MSSYCRHSLQRCLNFICFAYFLNFSARSSNVAHATYHAPNLFNTHRRYEGFGGFSEGEPPITGYSSWTGEGHEFHQDYKSDSGLNFGGYRHSGFSSNKDYKCGNVKVSKLTDVVNELGEEPFWDARSRSVFFVDRPPATVYRYEIDSKQLYFTKLGDNASISGVIPIIGEPGKYLFAYKDKVSTLTWDGVNMQASYQLLFQLDPVHSWPESSLTEVKVFPNGAVFFHSRPVPSPTTGLTLLPRRQSSLYNIVNGHPKKLLSNLDFGNGIGYDYLGEWIYHSDSLQNVTYKSRYDPVTNAIWDTRVLLNYTEKAILANPDSLAVDKEGYVWVALYSGSGIVKVNPNSGEVACFFKLPAERITNVAFGECPNVRSGKLDCLYVTTSSQRINAPSIYDGTLLLVEGTGSEGVLPNRVQWNEIAGRASSYSYTHNFWYS